MNCNYFRVLRISCVALVFVGIFSLTYVQRAYSQYVGIQIQNVLQERPVWCWLAVAQQVSLYTNGFQNTVSQCEMANFADLLRFGRLYTNFCYDRMNARPGDSVEIQALIAHYSKRHSVQALPANPHMIFEALTLGRIIIMQVKMSQFMGHVLIIRGIDIVPTQNNPIITLYVNDPAGQFAGPISFDALYPYWQSAIVVF